ncbi:MAG TPA: STAS/SEC14 domain-containing protein [Blastocatellia bacterium]|nr:STAS/SEC14 domain-containing protein [Blastocatellia bacterium]
MPSHQFDNNILNYELTGHYTLEDYKNGLNEALSDPSFHKGTKLLIDARNSAANFTYAEAEARVRILGSIVGQLDRQIALVVHGTFHYGLARMFSTIAECRGLRIAIFDDVEPARKWLLGEDQFDLE